MTAADRTPVLLAAIDNALRNGSYMTGANLAFEYLCDDLGIDREALPPFEPRWPVAERAAREAARVAHTRTEAVRCPVVADACPGDANGVQCARPCLAAEEPA